MPQDWGGYVDTMASCITLLPSATRRTNTPPVKCFPSPGLAGDASQRLKDEPAAVTQRAVDARIVRRKIMQVICRALLEISRSIDQWRARLPLRWRAPPCGLRGEDRRSGRGGPLGAIGEERQAMNGLVEVVGKIGAWRDGIDAIALLKVMFEQRADRLEAEIVRAVGIARAQGAEQRVGELGEAVATIGAGGGEAAAGAQCREPATVGLAHRFPHSAQFESHLV